MTADALVVGAGPAGCVAALRLARAGLRVRLLDRASFPRHKLCGDTLNPGALALLDRLGASTRIRGEALRTTGMRVTGPGGASVEADYPDGLYGLALSRHALDAHLVDEAVSAGVTFEPGVLVQEPCMSDDGSAVTGVRIASGRESHVIPSRIVIAADGRASRLASGLRLARFAPSPKRWAYGAYFENVTGVTTRGEMHIRPDGYIGIAPLPGGLTNVCVVKAQGTDVARREAHHQPVSFGRLLGEWLAGDAVLRPRFERAIRVSDVMALGPLAVDARGAGAPGLLLAGDAAGFVDPMTGDGMRFALRGGELAADAALRELDTGEPAHAWLARVRAREFAGKWRINRALRALVGSPRALDLAAVVARRWGAPVEYLIGVAGDVSLARS
jgi:geranylgeranyl reductase family protein